MQKLMCIVKTLIKSLSIWAVFIMGALACPMDLNPLATLMKHCRTGTRKQWRGSKKSKKLVTMLFRSGGANLEKYCVIFLALKMNFVRTRMLRTLILIFVMFSTQVETRLLNHITESWKGKSPICGCRQCVPLHL